MIEVLPNPRTERSSTLPLLEPSGITSLLLLEHRHTFIFFFYFMLNEIHRWASDFSSCRASSEQQEQQFPAVIVKNIYVKEGEHKKGLI